MGRRRVIVWGVAAVGATALGGALAATLVPRDSAKSADVTVPDDKAQPPAITPHRQIWDIPNVTLTTHEGKDVRFYDDLIKGKIVVINFMYATCTGT